MNYKLNANAGDTFSSVAEKAKILSKEKKTIVEFDFNGVNCLVNSSTQLDWLYRDYSNSWTMSWESVGPNCVPLYDEETQNSLDELTKIKQEKIDKEAEESRKKEKLEREGYESKTKDVNLLLKNSKLWNETRSINSDSYGGAAMDYAEFWAKLMQVEIDNGKTLVECAEKTSFELGFLGITGFMYGFAVKILSECWEYGEDLRKWHNKDYGYEGEGTVNPAIISIESK